MLSQCPQATGVVLPTGIIALIHLKPDTYLKNYNRLVGICSRWEKAQ